MPTGPSSNFGLRQSTRLIILLLVDGIVQLAHQNLAETPVAVLVLLRLNAVLVRVMLELLLTDFEQSADLVDGVILLIPR